MKPVPYIWIILNLSLVSIAYGQEFAPIGAEWYYSSSAGGAAPSLSEYYHLVVEQDTTINNRTLRKINRTYYRYRGDSVKLTPYFIYQQADTVFFYDQEINKYYRLLIFNANQGDTLLLDIPYDNFHLEDTTYRVVIDSVVTEIYDNTELKKYVLDQIDEFGWYYSFYLEKVGGYEWFLPIGIYTIPEHDGPIRCYHDNEIDINFWGNDCEYRIINSLDDFFAERFTIFPNPTSGLVEVSSEFKINRIAVLDISGKKNTGV